ncbi:MAG: hypothetical protein ACRDTM_17935 [Micromonosporaceae bacterium]
MTVNTIGAAPQLDPELKKIAESSLQAMKYSFAAVAADPDAAAPGDSVEEHFRAAVRSLKPDALGRVRDQARALVGSPATRTREFGEYGKAEPAAYRSTGFGSAVAASRLQISDTALKEALKRRPKVQIDIKPPKPPKRPKLSIKVPKVTAVRLHFDWVHCVDETDGEWPGSDTILFGGLAVDENGNAKKVDAYKVRPNNQPDDGFDDGDKRTFSYPKGTFASFPVAGKADWPRWYSAIVVMAEEDHGGFSGALQMAWVKAAPEIKKKVEKYVGDFAAEYVGEAFGQLIGEIVGWVVEAFAGWIIGLLMDDLFKPGFTYIGLHTPVAAGYEKGWWTDYRAPSGRFTFKGHGGKYTVDCHWQVDHS